MMNLDYDDLLKEHGKEKALAIFEAFKNNPPTEPISRDFADYLTNLLPVGFMAFERAEWGLESEESDYLQWCEQYHFFAPSIGAEIFIEVGDYHYFVSLDTDGFSEGETIKHQDGIIELLTEWAEEIREGQA
jgi:hypothetical protein